MNYLQCGDDNFYVSQTVWPTGGSGPVWCVDFGQYTHMYGCQCPYCCQKYYHYWPYPKTEVKPHTCPVCSGIGKNYWQQQCVPCKGSGTVWGPPSE